MSFITEVVKEFLNGCSNVSIIKADCEELELEVVFKVYLLFNQELDNMLKDKRLAELLKEDRE